VSPAENPVAVARAALGASTQTTEPEAAVFYVASARLAFARAKEELRELERVLIAREKELARLAGPTQRALPEAKP
jgi:hypothetical protein